ncbi:MAG: phosphatase PAP2 family protein [Caldimicrobium sp.]|nr:phosphatase PAP2 family protein [Caldimicrobium sp.]MCX7874511.1 phosphatase PAP2 family protein [Caldimicrobium sp.]MDW8094532.1 phosphatase PAP2 family protein [Caldimicrobium sp.]
MIEKLLALDIELFYLINGLRNPLLDRFIPLFSKETFLIVSYLSLLGMLFFMAWRKKLVKRLGPNFIIIFTLLGLGYGISDFTCGKIIKPLVARDRPCGQLKGVYYYSEGKFIYLESPRADKKNYGFPSCHVANATFVSTFYSLSFPKGSPIFLSLALLVGFSRVYLGHHFPGDVLGGMLIGISLALTTFFAYRWILSKGYV